MRFRMLVSLVVAILALGLLPAAQSAGQATTDVYIVHGLNFAGQDEQSDGGSIVTVCVDGSEVIGDFEFGDTFGPVPLETGQGIEVDVFYGADVPCGTNSGVGDAIGDSGHSVEGAAMSLVASRFESELTLFQNPLNVDCVEAGDGRLTAVHAADAGGVNVFVDDALVGELGPSETLDADLPEGTYSVEVVLQPSTTIVGPTDIPVDLNTNRVIFVVGNLFNETPFVPLLLDIDLDECVAPTTTTTTTTTAPTSTSVPTTAAAQPTALAPTFTG